MRDADRSQVVSAARGDRIDVGGVAMVVRDVWEDPADWGIDGATELPTNDAELYTFIAAVCASELSDDICVRYVKALKAWAQ